MAHDGSLEGIEMGTGRGGWDEEGRSKWGGTTRETGVGWGREPGGGMTGMATN